MPQQATLGISREFAARDPAPSPEVDYDAEYGALDLPPGAALREIQDRARLLSAAFHPDGLPGALQVPAAERAMQITLAADRLSRYWRSYGAPPPSGRPTRRGPARRGETGQLFGTSERVAAAPAVERPAPRLQLVPQAVQPQAHSAMSGRTDGGPSAALRAAIATRRVAAGAGRPQEPQKRHPLAIAGSTLFRLAMAALVVAAVARVQQYRAEHPALSAYSDPSTVTAVGMPGEPPVRWAGLRAPARPMVGAAAPAIAGRQRPD